MIRGMEAVVVGDVPVGGGLSSSSAVVVAFMEALTSPEFEHLAKQEE